jgi:hypothetical protein
VIELQTLKALLATDIEHVARSLLTEIEIKRGTLWGRDRAGDLWVCELRGRKQGVCFNAGSGVGANALDFVRHAGAAADLHQTRTLAESLLGLGTAAPNRLREMQQIAADRQARKAEEDRHDLARRAEDIRQRATEYAEGQAIARDCPAARYLEARQCKPASPAAGYAIRSAGHVARGKSQSSYETMLAPLYDPTAWETRAWHETVLAQRPDGTWIKRSGLQTSKRVWGPAGGCVIPIAHGAASTVLIAEGIENALTAHALLPELTTVAGYSVGNLAQIALPERFGRVVLVRDRETNPRSHGPRARAAAIARWLEEGRSVSLLDPPSGFVDINDAAQKRGAQYNPVDPLPEGAPVAEVPEARDWCAALGGAPGLLEAHPALPAGNAKWPAVLARAIAADGEQRGLVALLLDGGRLVYPWRCWGELRHTALELAPKPARDGGRLAIGLERAIAYGAHYAAIDFGHFAELGLSRTVWDLTVIAPPPAGDDEALLWREGLRQLHHGRNLTVLYDNQAAAEAA